MRNGSTKGFTLIELLIVIAIIGILAAVLIPNLLNARERAFDSASQTCLRELSTQLEVAASNSPFEYDELVLTAGDPATDAPTTINIDGAGDEDIDSCDNIYVTSQIDADAFAVGAIHENGTTSYAIQNGSGVVPWSEEDADGWNTDADLAEPAVP